jgi:hypothetical protein
MPTTYDKIASTTLGSATSTITFDSIAATYTDLRLVFVGKCTAGAATFTMRFNNNSGSNYSGTYLWGEGSSASSARITSDTSFQITYPNGLPAAQPAFYAMDIFSYAGSTNKTMLTNINTDLNGSGSVMNAVHLWRQTSAITRIDLLASNFATGSTATLYGILKF